MADGDIFSAGTAGISSIISSALQNAQAQHLANQAQSFDVAQSQWQTMANQQQNIESQQYNAIEAQKARDFAAQQQTQAEAYNTAQVQQQQAYETQMSNTAFQRSRADAVAAGLNPMVLAGMGGASTPSVSAGSIGATGGPAATSGPGSPAVGATGRVAPVASFQNAISSAMDAYKLKPTIDLMGDQAGQARSASGREDASARNYDANTALTNLQYRIAEIGRNVAQAEAEPKILRANAERDVIRDRPEIVKQGYVGQEANKAGPSTLYQAPSNIIAHMWDFAKGLWENRGNMGFGWPGAGPNNAKVSAGTVPWRSTTPASEYNKAMDMPAMGGL